MFFLWRRMDEDDRRRVWRLYGWFSGLMMCGSCFGAVAWAARMMYQVNLSAGLVAVQKRVQDAEGYSYLASFCSWRAAFIVTYQSGAIGMYGTRLPQSRHGLYRGLRQRLKLSGDTLKVPAPDLFVCVCQLCLHQIQLDATRELVPSSAALYARPRDWVPSWQFVRRAAPPSRAPTLLCA